MTGSTRLVAEKRPDRHVAAPSENPHRVRPDDPGCVGQCGDLRDRDVGGDTRSAQSVGGLQGPQGAGHEDQIHTVAQVWCHEIDERHLMHRGDDDQDHLRLGDGRANVLADVHRCLAADDPGGLDRAGRPDPHGGFGERRRLAQGDVVAGQGELPAAVRAPAPPPRIVTRRVDMAASLRAGWIVSPGC